MCSRCVDGQMPPTVRTPALHSAPCCLENTPVCKGFLCMGLLVSSTHKHSPDYSPPPLLPSSMDSLNNGAEAGKREELQHSRGIRRCRYFSQTIISDTAGKNVFMSAVSETKHLHSDAQGSRRKQARTAAHFSNIMGKCTFIVFFFSPLPGTGEAAAA